MITVKTQILSVIVFICAACIYSADAARGGGGGRFGGSSRFSSSRYSSSRYSSSRYSSSRYSYSYRSYRSYRSYNIRFSSRYRYRSSYYRRSSTVAVSTIGMGGITGNKQALLLAGSVYVAYSVRPQIFLRSGVLHYSVLDDYAICSGLVRWNPISKNGSYAYDDDLDSENGTTTNSIMTTSALAVPTASPGYGNGSVGTTSQTQGGYVTYNYFLCPSDLFDNQYDSEDTFCCGPSGSQMCCSEDDFNEQLGNTANSTLTVVLTFAFIIVGFICFLLYFLRKKIRNKCRSAGTPTPAPRADVAFHQVSKSGDEPQVVFAGGSIGSGQPYAADFNAPSNGFSEQPAYPLHPAEGSVGGNPVPAYPFYPPQTDGGAKPQYPLYPPVNGDGALQPPLPSHPPPSYAAAQYS